MSGLYVYALADRAAVPHRSSGRAIEFEDLGGIYAAVERRAAPPALSEEELRAQHAIVAEIAGEAAAVLPARFGSFVARAELQRVVDLRRGPIREALDLVRGRCQMTLRIVRDATGRRARHPHVDDRREGHPGTQYLLERRAASRPDLPSEVIDAVNFAVRALTFAARVEPGAGSVAAKVYHLIERGAVDEYQRALAGAALNQPELSLVATGPWPAFAFTPELWP